MAVSDVLNPALDLLFPPRCPLCGAGLATQTGVCVECWNDLEIPGQPCCSACQRPFGEGDVADGAICAPCMAHPPRHAGIAAGTIYNEASRRLVLSFKYGGKIALASLMARMIAARLGEFSGDWLVVPVPLHRWRLWSRGYNQAAVLASELARLQEQTLAVDLLTRAKRTPKLGGLGKAARKRALSGSIRIHPRWAGQLNGRDVLLVDDVLTSGATTNACIFALKRAGVGKVKIACFARVIDET